MTKDPLNQVSSRGLLSGGSAISQVAGFQADQQDLGENIDTKTAVQTSY